MEYLLFLQNLRESAPGWLNDAILFVSEMAGGSYALVFMALVFWCISRRAGGFLLMNFSTAYMFNQIVKNIFCVQRPFLKDTRLTPYVTADGYSFPSGHTMLGTAVYGSIAKMNFRRVWVAIVCAALILLTAFGRNWVGVHTPQDVIVGICASALVIAGNSVLLDWLERHPDKDWTVCLAAIAVSLAVYFLIPGSEKVIGIYLGAMLGLAAERRFVKHEAGGCVWLNAGLFVLGAGILFALYKVVLPAVFSSQEGLSEGITYFVLLIYITCLWPAAMRFAKALVNRSARA